MSHFLKSTTAMVTAACLTAVLSAAPVHLTLDGTTGAIALQPSYALAKRGSDDGGSDDRGGSSSSSDDDDHDRSGRDHDDDDDDDSRGRGRGSDDSDGHRSGGHRSSSNAGGATGGTGGNGINVVKFESTSNSVEVIYSNGWKEEIENGRYERKNPSGRTVEERRATQADADRLMALR
jgi:hypothetical protein